MSAFQQSPCNNTILSRVHSIRVVNFVGLLFIIPAAQNSVREMQQMERMHDSVLDAIHAALSKESLIKKLVLPFNETIDSATKVNI